jgi:uncharacterized protein DUF2716
MEAWRELTEAEDREVWKRVQRDFGFRPSVHVEHWPSIREPAQSITYAVPERYTGADLDDLQRHALNALQVCTRPEERLYALNWHHTCFWLRPHGVLRQSGIGVWYVPVLPNGDYSVFLAEDFRFGIFGHPWERTWCVFGAALLTAFEAETPALFSSVIRRGGVRTAP